ncbi:hypothetical protein SAMN02745127_01374 [Oceanospirillum multiglobuliferum]|uniref:Amidohydrolase 3 domain-containing protein n=1 Tax=Oceanospirillum multiglobuliferum TaxID=64969 RepID=A0A1T4P687_9GAMM|nr:amidohydrolase family protein [Oceanospirillum multiglobuliferum]OPX54855.1 hypothetical protein BTE48_12120 [Oceanospirillum multiglobuliferum]SJZ86911.1 hypothetical protein SAMN02745127_01374 [Oceanospirillum multiglobuliferum]
MSNNGIVLEHACLGHSHTETDTLTCSCCSPIWKYFLSPKMFENQHQSDRSPLSEEPATQIFRVKKGLNGLGHIYTLAGGKDVSVEAIGIQNGRIVATGTYEEVKAAMPDCMSEQSLESGHTLIPGMFEPHLHIITSAVFNTMVDVGPFEGQTLRQGYTRDFVIESLKDYVEKDEMKWILGRNVDPSLLKGNKVFNESTLNEASEKKPIFLMNSSMHVGYVNRVAIERVKAFFAEKDEKEKVAFLDTCDGILKELPELGPVLQVIAVENPLNADRLHKEIAGIFSEASKRGVTSVLEAGLDPASVEKGDLGPSFIYNQPAILKSIAENNCPVRISAALAATTLADFNDNIEGRYTLNTGNELFNIPFIKILSDGSNQGLTGLQFQPYECNENYLPYNKVGEPSFDQDVSRQTNIGLFNYGYPIEYDTLIKKIVDNGWSMIVHANGDQAASRTVNAFERAGVTKATKELRRDRIDHASLLSDETLEKMYNLGISPSFLIGHVGYWGWAFQQMILGAEKSQLLDRCQSAISNHDMRITLHSDYSVTPLGPLRMMEQAITRIMEGAPDMPRPNNDPKPENETLSMTSSSFPVLHKEEQISRFQALKAATYDAAWQCHADQWTGSLEVGKCADFVILEESPLTYSNPTYGVYSAFGMRDIKVLETWKGGVKRYHNTEV